VCVRERASNDPTKPLEPSAGDPYPVHVRTCPACGEQNSDQARFCQACGTPLTEAASSRAREERKIVSVLFVDLVEFTDRSDRADPEDVRAMLRPYHSLLKREIERFGGTVEKFIGDAVMAVFGAPVAHEDDAERAVRAALRILEAVDELRDSSPRLDLTVRGAVNTGEAVVSLAAGPERGEGLVAGDVVNTAARMQSAAPTGAVVVGETTYRATRDGFTYEELAPAMLKGKSEPVLVWRVLDARSRFGVDLQRAVVTPLIGRDRELEALKAVFERSVTEPSVQLVTITGEPGVGKSRLASELGSYIDDRTDLLAWWKQGRCLSYGDGVTFWALGEILKAHAGILESDARDEASRKLQALVASVVPEGPERHWYASRLAPLVGVSSEEAAHERDDAFIAWRQFFEAIAEKRPLVLFFEDLHWADDALVEFIDHIVDWSTDVPLCVLCTARPELFERHPGWGGGKRNSTTISLSPLTGEQTQTLISSLLSRAALPEKTRQALLEHSGGNPLYAEEFVRMVTDRGLLDGRAEFESMGPVNVPETVQALIAARLDTLSTDRKALLQDAAVLGKVFWSGALATMRSTDEREVVTQLHELVRKELVRPARHSSVEGQKEYAFWHLLVRDVAYGQIPRAERAHKHVSAAQWIEDISPGRIEDQAEVLADHYTRALELSKASAEQIDVTRIEEESRRFLELAGDRAQHLDPARAQAYYRRAIDLMSPEDTRRPHVLRKAGVVASSRGAWAEAEPFLRTAVEEFGRRGDELAQANAMVDLDRVLSHGMGDTAQGLAVLEEARGLVEKHPPGPEMARVYSMMAGRYMLAGRYRDSLEQADMALEIVRPLELTEQVARCLNYRGIARASLGDARGIDDLREAVRMTTEENIETDPTSFINLAGMLWWSEGPPAAMETYDAALQWAERFGQTWGAEWARAETTWLLYDLGRWDELLSVGEEVRGRAMPRSQIWCLPTAHMAAVLLQRGRTDHAARVVDELLPRAREIGDVQVVVPALWVNALLEAARGEASHAVPMLNEAARIAEGERTWLSVLLPDAMRILLDFGRVKEATQLFESLRSLEPMFAARDLNAKESSAALLAEAAGKTDEAVELFRAAVRGWRDYGSVVEKAHALLGAGRCLIALGKPGEAAADITAARGIVSGLGATRLTQEADALLARASVPS
jgi:class 3 adenylate cyclase/tetratricopeptide (TPR) repeat protein